MCLLVPENKVLLDPAWASTSQPPHFRLGLSMALSPPLSHCHIHWVINLAVPAILTSILHPEPAQRHLL